MRSLAYVSFQELATRVSHRNTGRFTDDPMADQLLARIAADENLHMIFYRNLLERGAADLARTRRCARSPTWSRRSRCPAPASPGFQRKAVEMAIAGIYDIRQHRDDVVAPVLRFWKVFEHRGPVRRG